MNTKFQSMTLLVTLLIAGLISCRKDGIIVQQAQGVAVSNARAANGWLLTKQGNNVLEYRADKKLQKVTFADGSAITYSYGLNSIMGECIKNGMSLYKVTYLINASGNAYYMHYKSDMADLTYNLNYENGRLVEQKRSFGKETYKFIYDGQNRLSRMEFYNSDGIKKQVVMYSYGSEPMADNNQINPEEAFLERYQPIFGTFSQHLCTQVAVSNGPAFFMPNFFYDMIYEINNYGQVTERKKYQSDLSKPVVSSTLIETAKYEYQQRGI